MKILNLTQHTATPEQLAAGVTTGELSPEQVAEIRSLLTFDTLPTIAEVENRARRLGDIAQTAIWRERSGLPYATEANFFEYAMIGGAPYLMPALDRVLRGRGIEPLFAFSVRESVESVEPDGSVRKIAVFRHAGFIGLLEADAAETVDVLSEEEVARYRDLPIGHMTATDSESVTALFEQMKASDDAYNLELSVDGTVGRWSAEDYLQIGRAAEIVAVLRDGIVYRY